MKRILVQNILKTQVRIILFSFFCYKKRRVDIIEVIINAIKSYILLCAYLHV